MAYPDLTLQPAFTVQSINERMVRIGKRIQRLSENGKLDQPITLSGGVTGTGTEAITVTVVTNANLTGPITSVGNTTAVAAQTGTGSKFVMSVNPAFDGPIILKGYTVATLPAGIVGMRAYVTDAAAPAYGAAVVGGGAVVVPVFYDGGRWVTA